MSEQLSIKAEGLTKIYRRGSEEIRAVDGVSLYIKQGEFVSFVGPSGSGKTTLINILGCLDNPTAGKLELSGRSVFDQGKAQSEFELTKVRRETFGYVFQKFYLIPTLTVYENVVLPFTFYKKPGAEQGVDKILSMLGIDHRKRHLPGQISGGEMQRVAIARALVNKPKILLADEPTGNLDTRRSSEIGILLGELNKWEGLTVIVVTHNVNLAKMAYRAVELRDGKIHHGPETCVPTAGCT
ncbi:MAG: ABC transporter ATP-binding protein [Candidatus Edwardsbacteria bacterium]|nr:ABC transporter ATP-binding protein [Candidatus Edwardsbacteria bacterium]